MDASKSIQEVVNVLQLIVAVAVVSIVGALVARWYMAPRALNTRREVSLGFLLSAIPVVLLTQSRGVDAGQAAVGLAASGVALVAGFGLGRTLVGTIRFAGEGTTTLVGGGAPYIALAIAGSVVRFTAAYVLTGSIVPIGGANAGLATVIGSVALAVAAGAWIARARQVVVRSHGVSQQPA